MKMIMITRSKIWLLPQCQNGMGHSNNPRLSFLEFRTDYLVNSLFLFSFFCQMSHSNGQLINVSVKVITR